MVELTYEYFTLSRPIREVLWDPGQVLHLKKYTSDSLPSMGEISFRLDDLFKVILLYK